MMPAGLDGRKMVANVFFTAFPNVYVTIDNMVAEEDRIATQWSAVGTHKGELLGLPATGKEATINGMTVDRLVDGKSVEHWEIIDMAGLMQQLGATS